MPISNKDHGRVTMSVAVALHSFNEGLDFHWCPALESMEATRIRIVEGLREIIAKSAEEAKQLARKDGYQRPANIIRAYRATGPCCSDGGESGF